MSLRIMVLSLLTLREAGDAEIIFMAGRVGARYSDL